MKELLTITPQTIRQRVLATIENDEEFVSLLEEFYEGLQQLLDTDDLNPREEFSLYDNGKKIISHLKVSIGEYEGKLPRLLKVKMKLINEQIYCTPIKELKEKASKYVSDEDVHEIIYKMDMISAVQTWMESNNRSKESDSLQKAIYVKFSEACKEMRRRNRIEYNIDKLDKGYHNFQIKSLKKLDADLLLSIVKEFNAVATDDNIEVSFGKLVVVNTIYRNYSRSTLRQEPKLTDLNQPVKLLLEGIKKSASMKYQDYLDNTDNN